LFKYCYIAASFSELSEEGKEGRMPRAHTNSCGDIQSISEDEAHYSKRMEKNKFQTSVMLDDRMMAMVSPVALHISVAF
jgi:hypothetical protein